MSFDVDIRKNLRSERRSFELAVRFTTRARRCVIFGPSGAGKSLTLQALAGLLTPDSGRIAFDDDVLFDHAAGIDQPARRRGFGFLFQDYALFPRLNVRQNIAFGLQHGLRNPSAKVAGAAVDHWLHAFELQDVAAERPDELSGGQRQRTALARALVHSPRALLLDEPFSALDPDLRERMRAELDELLQRIGIPVLMITHDPDDLAWFGDEALYLRGGRIAASPMAPPVRRNSTRPNSPAKAWPPAPTR
jgi:molybdate transport system ATP-binding protein